MVIQRILSSWWQVFSESVQTQRLSWVSQFHCQKSENICKREGFNKRSSSVSYSGDLTLAEDVKTKGQAFPVEEGCRSPRRLPPPSMIEERQAELASLNPGFYYLRPSTPQKLTTCGGRRKEGDSSSNMFLSFLFHSSQATVASPRASTQLCGDDTLVRAWICVHTAKVCSLFSRADNPSSAFRDAFVISSTHND